jgi:hypothetical protein
MTALGRRDDMAAGIGQSRHYLVPGVRLATEAAQQHAPVCRRSNFPRMDTKTTHTLPESGTAAWRQGRPLGEGADYAGMRTFISVMP